MGKRIDLFVEDGAHREVLSVLVRRLCAEADVESELTWRNATRGFGGVARELKTWFGELGRAESPPDVVVVATDGNCRGAERRKGELPVVDLGIPVVHAIPDPHIERWLLLDGRAFKQVLGVGCKAPDRKCDRDRYKQLLAEQVVAADVVPLFGGLEYAPDIMEAMDIERACRADKSFRQFVAAFRQALAV